MTVYVVFREGVYRYECGGVFSSLPAAEAAARAYKAGEPVFTLPGDHP